MKGAIRETGPACRGPSEPETEQPLVVTARHAANQDTSFRVPTGPPIPREAEERAWSRAFRVGVIASILLHAALLLYFHREPVPVSPFVAAGPDRGDVEAAAGGSGGMEIIEFRIAAAQPEAPATEPVPVSEPETPPVEVPVERPPTPTPEPPRARPAESAGGSAEGRSETPGTGGDRGEVEGPGTATGTGQGAGGSAESGDGDDARITPPSPRGLILPPSGAPASARGKEMKVWVFVAASGRVVADSTRLEPPTSDAGYNRKLKRSVADWRFTPARKAGAAVGAWYPFEIIL